MAVCHENLPLSRLLHNDNNKLNIMASMHTNEYYTLSVKENDLKDTQPP